MPKQVTFGNDIFYYKLCLMAKIKIIQLQIQLYVTSKIREIRMEWIHLAQDMDQW
jgi:hypothetical protein